MGKVETVVRFLLGYAPKRNRSVTQPFLSREPSSGYDWPLPRDQPTMIDHPVRALHHIRRDLDEIVSSLHRAIRRKDFHTMAIDVSRLTALGPRIDAVTAAVQAGVTLPADQQAVDASATDLEGRVTALEAAVGIKPAGTT